MTAAIDAQWNERRAEGSWTNRKSSDFSREKSKIDLFLTAQSFVY